MIITDYLCFMNMSGATSKAIALAQTSEICGNYVDDCSECKFQSSTEGCETPSGVSKVCEVHTFVLGLCLFMYYMN